RRKVHYRDFSDNNIQRFRQLMHNMNFDCIMQCNDANVAYNIFENMYKLCYDNAFPLKVLNSKKVRKPYITEDLLQRIKTRDKLKQKFFQTKNHLHLVTYKKYRNRLSQNIYNAKRRFILQQFSNCPDAKSM